MSAAAETESVFGDLLRRGCTVAVGDGFGAPASVFGALSQAAADVGDVRLFLGWMPVKPTGLDFDSFVDARTVMPGWGLRTAVAAGAVRFIPTRLSAVPALLHNVISPDVLVASVVRTPDGHFFANEVSWQRAAVAAGAIVAAVENTEASYCDAGPPLPPDRVVVVGHSNVPPADMPVAPADPVIDRMIVSILPLICAGSHLQVGPGALGSALLRRLDVPVHVDSGLLPDEVVDLDHRGLLMGDPVTAYLAGGQRLREWVRGRPVLHPIEYTHNIGRLSGQPFVAVNTAVEIDIDGQINVEGTASAVFGGIGGHADYAAAAAAGAGGLSVIAVRSEHNGRSTLVQQLSRPVSTPAHDVGIVITEGGAVDLRRLDRVERQDALIELWGASGIREQEVER